MTADQTPDRADHRGRSPGDCERCAHEHLATPDRASAEGLREAAQEWADLCHDYDLNERGQAVMARLRAALRDTGPRPDSGIDVERLLGDVAEAAEHECWDGDNFIARPLTHLREYARLSTPRETSDSLLDAERDALL